MSLANVRSKKVVFPLMLKSILYRNRTIWLNGHPFLNYLLPLSNLWTIRDLEFEMMRACADYGVYATGDAVHALALRFVKQVCKDSIENRGASLGWD